MLHQISDRLRKNRDLFVPGFLSRFLSCLLSRFLSRFFYHLFDCQTHIRFLLSFLRRNICADTGI